MYSVKTKSIEYKQMNLKRNFNDDRIFEVNHSQNNSSEHIDLILFFLLDNLSADFDTK